MTTWLAPLATPRLSCLTYEIGTGIARLVPTGGLSRADESELKRALASIAPACDMVVVDLRDLAVLDPSGVQLLRDAEEDLGREGRRLVLVNRRPDHPPVMVGGAARQAAAAPVPVDPAQERAQPALRLPRQPQPQPQALAARPALRRLSPVGTWPARLSRLRRSARERAF